MVCCRFVARDSACVTSLIRDEELSLSQTVELFQPTRLLSVIDALKEDYRLFSRELSLLPL